METTFRNLLTQLGESVGGDSASTGLLALTNGVLLVVIVLQVLRGFFAPKKRLSLTIDAPPDELPNLVKAIRDVIKQGKV